MPLPTDAKAPWPPKSPVTSDIAEAAAWYEGDPSKLTSIYCQPDRSKGKGDRARFWSKASNAPESRQRLHLPAAADIAAVSADLLFGDTPTFKAEAKEAQARIEELMEQQGIGSTLLESAEIASGLGGVYLRPAWDTTVSQHPMLTVVHADNAAPEFRWGKLSAVTFWRTVHTDEKGNIWRHLERHEPGVVLHGLYIGDDKTLGVRRNLADHADTASLIADGAMGPDEDGVLRLPGTITGLLVRYVPNVLPNRKHRALPIGRSDTAGTESLMDSLDEVWTSWMRDIRLGKMRIVVPYEYLEQRGRGQGASFDTDTEIFSPLEMEPSATSKAGISPVEFKIRTDEHAATAKALMEQITRTAGFSPQSLGIEVEGGGIQTATEIEARTDQTERTVSRKRRYFAPAVEDIIEILLIIEAELLGGDVKPERPKIVWPEHDQDPEAMAKTVQALSLAEAISIETKVKMVHPEWDADVVALEVAAIKSESGMAVEEPTGAGGLP